MMGVYLLTLNHSYSFGNLQPLAEVAGWNWRPNVFGPVTFLATYPFRFLPLKVLPLALNLFSAFCGALVLALLARSVALLPHDRTQAQRQRELSDYSLLTIKTAWIPPLLAVLVCGLQMTFWENAMEFTGEMIDLLIFAYCIRCVLEYRIEQRESWLIKFALVCGLGMANNWAMIGYLPAFLIAFIWIKGVSFFNLRLMLKMTGCGLLGFLLIILLPLKAIIADPGNGTFFQAMKYVLSADKFYLWNFWHFFPKETLLVLILPFFLPLILMGIRWSSFFGDTSQFGIFLTTAAFHIVHALFLGACIWVALDPPFSPRQSAHLVYGLTPFITFYYLGALNVGYFTGYFLLIFGKKAAKSRHRTHPAMRMMNRVVVASVCLLLVAVPLLLVFRNLPKIASNHGQTISQYCSIVERSLPEKGAVVLSDDSRQILALQAYLSEQGKDKKYLLVDSGSLKNPLYFKYIYKNYPQYQLLKKGSQTLDSMGLIHLLDDLSAEYELLYLNSSFGYYFEEFHAEAGGLVYRLKAYDKNGPMLAPLPTPQEVAKNEDFWEKMDAETLSTLKQAIQPSGPESRFPVIQRIFDDLHLTREKDFKSLLIGTYYSSLLNHWGVILQRLGKLNDAAKYFERAQQFNPENASAQINIQFNKDLLAGNKPVIAPPKAIEDRFGKHRDWTEVLKQDGPFDEPNTCHELGVAFARGGLYRQAIEQFERVESLAPENLDSKMWLAQLYISTHSYSNALAAATKALNAAPNDTDALYLTAVSAIQVKDYENAIQLLDKLTALQPNNFGARLNRGIAYLQSGNLDAAKKDYEAVANVAPKAYQAFYGLAEIAYRKKDNSAAADYYRHYLTNAPPNTEEVKLVKSRLKELGADSP
jgi:tetratricopeptide (TPR) repeat protein